MLHSYYQIPLVAVLLSLLFMVGQSGCWPEADIKGLPCEQKEDCWSGDRWLCIQKRCSAGSFGEEVGSEAREDGGSSEALLEESVSGDKPAGSDTFVQEAPTEKNSEGKRETIAEKEPPEQTLVDQGPCTDGTVRSCYGGPTKTAQVGVCLKGYQFCNGGKWEAECWGEVRPGHEVCKDKWDGNCDGSGEKSCSSAFSCTPIVQKKADPKFSHGNENLTGIVASPDGRWFVSSGRDAWLFIWDMRTQQAYMARKSGSEGFPNSMAFTSDSQFLVVGFDKGYVKTISLKLKKVVSSITLQQSRVLSVAVHPENGYAVSSSLKETLFYSLGKDGTLTLLPSLTKGRAKSLRFSPDGSLLALGMKKAVALYVFTKGKLPQLSLVKTFSLSANSKSSEVDGLAFADWGKGLHFMYAGDKDAQIQIWDVSGVKKGQTLPAQNKKSPIQLGSDWYAIHLSVSHDHRYLLIGSRSEKKTYGVYDLVQSKTVFHIRHRVNIWGIHFAAHDYRFFLADDRKVYIGNCNK